MYLGRHLRGTSAEDSRTVFAQAPAVPMQKSNHRAPRRVAPASEKAPIALPAEETVNAREVERLRKENEIYRGRIRKLLDVLRGKNRTIARQEREIAALSQSDPLTVDQILKVEAKR